MVRDEGVADGIWGMRLDGGFLVVSLDFHKDGGLKYPRGRSVSQVHQG